MIDSQVKEPSGAMSGPSATSAREFRDWLLLERETILKRLAWIEDTLGLPRTKEPSHKKESRG